MRRVLAALGPCLVVLTAGAKCDEAEAVCKVDTDCPQGTICRDERCGALHPDGGNAPEAAVAASCSSEGTPCASADECCTRACESGRCSSSAPPVSKTCRGLSELCGDDCCAGLTCISGICR